MSGNPPPPVPLLQDNANLYAAEFLRHPDFRATAGFLLGWVFWSSICYASKSRFFQLLGHIFWAFIRRTPSNEPVSDIEARGSQDAEKRTQRRESGPSGVDRISNEAALVFTLNLCFAFASFAEFASILAYDPGGADVACAFTVAWGSMAAQAARLIGLAILVLRLKQRGAKTVEFYALCTALVFALSFILGYNATNTGNMVPVHTLGISICIKGQFLPTALLTSVGFVLLELYVALRFLGWQERRPGLRSFVAGSFNTQVARASSLLLIEVLTFAPNVVITNVLAQFVPSSLGALIVLIAFNYNVYEPLQRQDELAEPTTPECSCASTPMPALQPARQSSSVVVGGSPMEPTSGGVIIFDNPMEAPSARVAVSANTPSSAPPRIGDKPVFADLQARQILPFQVEYAEQLDRHVHTGPIPPSRPRKQRPHVQVVIENVEAANSSRDIPSTIIGSDILRLPSAISSAKRQTKETKIWSPSTIATPSDYTASHTSSAATPTTAVRNSNLSAATSSFNRSLSAGSRNVFSGILSRQGSRKIRSPAETSLKMPWRSAPRKSFASARTFGAQDELPPVAEGHTEGATAATDSGSGSWRGSQSSAKRVVISRPHSLRSSRPSSPHPTRLGLQLHGVPAIYRPPSSQHLTVPEHLRSPVTPDSPRSMRASPGHSIVAMPRTPPSISFERAQGSGRLRGPRTPPTSGSAPNLRSAWPTAEEPTPAREGQPGHRRRRSGSCPELPPLDLEPKSLRPYPSVRRH
ncbi:hypothetical protein OH77DRAFT_1408107 [Trametes cingulata]|nr:hypothetical protein OH77DRAFT_1408107 [Trametes cingulata]